MWTSNSYNLYLRFSHLILNWKHDTDALKSKYCSSEENWKLFKTGEPWNWVRAGERCWEDVVEDDAETNKLQDVGEDRAGREVLEIPDAADEDDWQEKDSNVDPVVPAGSKVSLYDLNKTIIVTQEMLENVEGTGIMFCATKSM